MDSSPDLIVGLMFVCIAPADCLLCPLQASGHQQHQWDAAQGMGQLGRFGSLVSVLGHTVGHWLVY
jgi:hypothetical protein